MTLLDDLLTGTSASWVQDGERLDPGGVEAAVADRVARLAAVPVSPGETVVWSCANTIASLAFFRGCWRQGVVAAPTHPRLGDDIERALQEGHPTALPDDAAVVLFTAGSTGTPKGVVHTHGSLAHKARQMVAVHGLTHDDVVLMPAPLSHMSGLLNGLLVPGLAGMSTVLMERWDPALALDLIERERVSFMVGPPTFFLDLWRAPSFAADRVASLRLLSCGGAGVTAAFVDEAESRLGAVVKRTYGSTEAPTVATTPAELHGDPRRGTSDGRATPGTELRVVDGELWVRGPELFWGYLDAAQTAAVMADGGWYRTGDRAQIDDAGWVTITGRVRDLIIRGGENIAPAAVEAVLEAHPAIGQAVVVGLPDDRLGERVAAAVVVRPGATAPDLDEVRSWFGEQGAPRVSTPEHLVVLDDVPRLPSGKPDRSALTEAMTARRGHLAPD